MASVKRIRYSVKVGASSRTSTPSASQVRSSVAGAARSGPARRGARRRGRCCAGRGQRGRRRRRPTARRRAGRRRRRGRSPVRSERRGTVRSGAPAHSGCSLSVRAPRPRRRALRPRRRGLARPPPDPRLGRGDRPSAPVAAGASSSSPTTPPPASPIRRRRWPSVGIPATGDVLTSAVAAAALVEPGERVLVCGGVGVVEAITARGAIAVAGDDPSGETVDAVMVGLHRRVRLRADAHRRHGRAPWRPVHRHQHRCHVPDAGRADPRRRGDRRRGRHRGRAIAGDRRQAASHRWRQLSGCCSTASLRAHCSSSVIASTRTVHLQRHSDARSRWSARGVTAPGVPVDVPIAVGRAGPRRCVVSILAPHEPWLSHDSMAKNTLQRLLDEGVQFTEMSRKQAESTVKKLVKAGEVRRSEAEATVQSLLERGKETADAASPSPCRPRCPSSSAGSPTASTISRTNSRRSSPGSRRAAPAAPAKKAAGEEGSGEEGCCQEGRGQEGAGEEGAGEEGAGQEGAAKKAPAKKCSGQEEGGGEEGPGEEGPGQEGRGDATDRLSAGPPAARRRARPARPRRQPRRRPRGDRRATGPRQRGGRRQAGASGGARRRRRRHRTAAALRRPRWREARCGARPLRRRRRRLGRARRRCVHRRVHRLPAVAWRAPGRRPRCRSRPAAPAAAR